jgi:hypothetical protein
VCLCTFAVAITGASLACPGSPYVYV